jgi:hypothetical protein
MVAAAIGRGSVMEMTDAGAMTKKSHFPMSKFKRSVEMMGGSRWVRMVLSSVPGSLRRREVSRGFGGKAFNHE